MREKEMIRKGGHRQPAVLNLRRATAGDATQIKRRCYYLYSLNPDNGWSLNHNVSCIELDQGMLFVNGVQIVEPEITHDHITWLQYAKDANGTHYLAGCLHLNSSGLEAHGTVVVGKGSRDAVRHDVFATAIPNVTYQTRITSIAYPPDTILGKIPADKWQEGLDLQISYKQQVGNSIPSPIVILAGQDVSDYCSWSVDDHYTVLAITLDDSACEIEPTLYAEAKLSFDALVLDSPGVGIVRKRCSDTGINSNSVRLWKAVVQKPSAAANELNSHLLTRPLRQAITKGQLLSTANDDLAINELITLLPDDLVNEDANSMLMRNMKWAMGQDRKQKEWLTQFFNENPPIINEPNQQALAKQGLDWYQKKFAMAYLTQSFNSYSGPNQPDTRLNDKQAVKLTGYLKTGLAQEKDFTIQHQGIYIDAYIGVRSRLKQYITDNMPEFVGWAQGTVIFSRNNANKEITVPAGVTVKTSTGVVFMTQEAVTLAKGIKQSNPVVIAANEPGVVGIVAKGMITAFEDQSVPGIDGITNYQKTTLAADSGGIKWAKKLFTVLTTGSQFVLMVNRVAGAAGDPKSLGPVNNFSCLLTALDPSGEMANNYFRSIMSGLVVKLLPQVVHRDKDTIMQWLPATMQELFRKLANGELPNETDISKQEALEMYQEYLKHQADITAATAELLQSIVASGLIKQVQTAEIRFNSEIASRWPKLAKAGRFMLAIGWIGGVASVITALAKGDWKKMTDNERASFVSNCVQLAVSGFNAVPVIWQGSKAVTLSVWNKFNNWWNAPRQQGEIAAQRVNAGEDPFGESYDLQYLFKEAEEGAVLGKGTIFERMFAEGVFSGVLKAIGALAAVAAAGISLWKVIDDVKNHGSVSTKVFDSLIFTANFLSAVCLVADLFVATSFLPIAGAVLAIAGIIIGVIASFFEKPVNPLGKWLHDNGAPFVDKLPEQKTSLTVTIV